MRVSGFECDLEPGRGKEGTRTHFPQALASFPASRVPCGMCRMCCLVCQSPFSGQEDFWEVNRKKLHLMRKMRECHQHFTDICGFACHCSLVL